MSSHSPFTIPQQIRSLERRRITILLQLELNTETNSLAKMDKSLDTLELTALDTALQALRKQAVNTKLSYEQLVAMFSGIFLTRFLPEQWHEWDSSELYEFINNYAWEPLEDSLPSTVFQLIDSTARKAARIQDNA